MRVNVQQRYALSPTRVRSRSLQPLSGTPLLPATCSVPQHRFLLPSRTLLHWPSHVSHTQQVVCVPSLLSAGAFGIAQLASFCARAGFGTEVEFRAVDCDLLHLVACANAKVALEVYVFACFCPGVGSSCLEEQRM